MRPFQHAKPSTEAAAFELINDTTANVMANADGLIPTGNIPRGAGNDLLDLMKEGLFSPQRLVDVRQLPALQGIREAADAITIGAAARIVELEQNALFEQPGLQAIKRAAEHIAHPQIRATATVAGSLMQRPRCWYFRLEEADCAKKGGEGCPAIDGENQFHAIFDNQVCPMVHPATLATVFTALAAEVDIISDESTRRITFNEFLVSSSKDITRENSLLPGEIITSIRIPLPANRRSFHIKQGQRESYDWAIVDVATAADVQSGRLNNVCISLGSVAPVPFRARAAEAVLEGKIPSDALFRQAAKAAVQGAQPLSKNAYKVPMLEAVVRRTLEGMMAETV